VLADGPPERPAGEKVRPLSNDLRYWIIEGEIKIARIVGDVRGGRLRKEGACCLVREAGNTRRLRPLLFLQNPVNDGGLFAKGNRYGRALQET